MTFEEKTLDSQRIYEGKIINLRKDSVTVSGGVWTLERSYLEFIVNGGGTINGASSLVEPEFVSGGQDEPDKSTTYEFTITGATPSTSVTITNKQPGDATGSMWRCLIEEVRILEAY